MYSLPYHLTNGQTMIVTGTYAKPEHPVIVDLRTALGEAIDAQQVAIVRAYLDGEASA